MEVQEAACDMGYHGQLLFFLTVQLLKALPLA
jgi:hypothetical protein